MGIAKMRKVSRSLCVLGLAFSAGVCAAENPDGAKPAAPEKATLEQSLIDQRRKIYVAADAEVLKARKAWEQGDFDAANSAFEAADAILADKSLTGTAVESRRTQLEAERAKFKLAWAASLMSRARREGAAGRYDEAIALAGQAAMKDPDRAEEVEAFAAACRKQKKHQTYVKDSSLEAVNPKAADEALEIKKLFREARKYYAAGRYENARASLEKIYIIDPFNLEAADMLDRVYQKMINAAAARQHADLSIQYVDNQFRWISPVFLERTDNVRPVATESRVSTENTVLERMGRIIFENVEFDDADFMTVVRYFNSRSRSLDPEKIGVEITTSLEKDKLDALPKVMMSFSRIPMDDALRYLCRMVGLEYRVENNNVVIGLDLDVMQTENFKIRGDFIMGIGGGPSGLPTGATDDNAGTGTGGASGVLGKKGEGIKNEDIFDVEKPALRNTAPLISSEALKTFFEECGIPFPEGSEISYNAGNNVLRVHNRPENLRKISDLLRMLGQIETPLVMVEMKIVEIREEDWQELGFDWAFSAWQISSADPSNPTSAQNGVYSHWSSTQGTRPLRNGSGNDDGSSSIKLVNDFKLFPNFGNGIFKDTQVNVSLSINAVSQNSRSELLSSPRVVTRSGTTAKIRMTKQYYFPESWQAPTVNTNNNFSAITAPIPTFNSDPTDIGILLEVTPQVGPDNYTISLSLKPDIANYVGNTDDVVIVDQGWYYPNGSQQSWAGYPVEFSVWMPNITHRRMDVQVKVYDGETIVLGGMVDSQHKVIDDRWPIIGDIPLLGRLFSSQSDKKTRTNLIMFVTARLINSDGVPLRRSLPRGIPDFNR